MKDLLKQAHDVLASIDARILPQLVAGNVQQTMQDIEAALSPPAETPVKKKVKKKPAKKKAKKVSRKK